MARLPDAWFDPSVTMPEISSSNVSDVTVATSFPLRTNREPLALPAVDVPSCPMMSAGHSR
jgi:hypothetical protein